MGSSFANSTLVRGYSLLDETRFRSVLDVEAKVRRVFTILQGSSVLSMAEKRKIQIIFYNKNDTQKRYPSSFSRNSQLVPISIQFFNKI
jgi:hypothetical protein